VSVVSHTSPIINLAAIGQLQLLKQLYSKIILPEAVRQEIVVKGIGQAGSAKIDESKWIEVKTISNHEFIQALQLELDKGESEAIGLALELRADLLLIDERKARLVANRFGIHYIGILGILIEAKQNGLIKAAKPFLDNLIAKAGFWISQGLYNRVLKEVGEDNSLSL